MKKNLISTTICEIRTDMERKNINRGFKQLRVWQDSVALYILACKIFVGFPFDLKKVSSNASDAAHSISRNIAEGYCRRSLKEYLNHLNIALGSCGEFCSCYESFRLAAKITVEAYEELDPNLGFYYFNLPHYSSIPPFHSSIIPVFSTMTLP